jgi:hypothetical protein
MRSLSSREPSLVVVVLIEGEEIQDHLLLQVQPGSRISSMDNRIRDELLSIGLIGQLFRSYLEILPLQTTTAMSELRGRNLEELRTQAYRNPDNFPPVAFSHFFHRFYTQGQHDLFVHFLVWLPPRNREFLQSFPFE